MYLGALMFRANLGLLGAAILGGLLTIGTAAAQFTATSKPSFVERSSQIRAISGGTIVGLTLARQNPREKRLSLWVRPLANFSGKVQVSAVTNDGLYSGMGEFSGKSVARQWTNVLTLPDKGKPAAIRSARADPLFASLAETPSASGRGVMLAAWTADGQPPKGDTIAVAFQNLGASSRVRLVLPDRQKRDCVTGLGRGPSPVYNTVCRLSLAELDAMKALTIEIVQGMDVRRVQRPLL